MRVGADAGLRVELGAEGGGGAARSRGSSRSSQRETEREDDAVDPLAVLDDASARVGPVGPSQSRAGKPIPTLFATTSRFKLEIATAGPRLVLDESAFRPGGGGGGFAEEAEAEREEEEDEAGLWEVEAERRDVAGPETEEERKEGALGFLTGAARAGAEEDEEAATAGAPAETLR
jgi:hypothetical protein